ncbi:hypothetical protein D3C85_1161960 [compost metagenome]
MLEAVSLMIAPAQTGPLTPVTITSAAIAGGFTIRVTILASPAVFAHLFDPLTVK